MPARCATIPEKSAVYQEGISFKRRAGRINCIVRDFMQFHRYGLLYDFRYNSHVMSESDYTGALPEKVLKNVFGYDSFRPLQKEIIENVLAARDTLAVMPTGGGKSLCYQIPSLIFDGLTVVVSPLIALMQDQVASLVASGVNAVFLNSTVEWTDYVDSMDSIKRGETKIVYVSPEGLATQRIQDLLHADTVNVKCITIDEAHCVSEWGHDFRPDYLEIASVRKQFKNAVCLALTATATKQVREDIINNLKLKNPAVLVASFNRPNIYLDVKPKTDPLGQVVECIRAHWGESGIIYCFSRRQVDQLTESLSNMGYSVLNYHAGLTDEVRTANQTKFIRDEVQIMVATVAFGMGIDKPNVRYVIHYDMPKSLEQYYQEIGRSGRDGLPSTALLLYSAGDIHKIRYFFDESADRDKAEKLLQGMISYATAKTCRRRVLLSYFGETLPNPETGRKNDAKDAERTPCCDICDSGPVPEVDLTIPCQKFMSCIIRTNQRFGTGYIVDVLLGSRQQRILDNGHNMISTWGIGTELDRDQWFELAAALIDEGYLIKTDDYGVLMLSNDGAAALRNRDTISLQVVLAPRQSNKKAKTRAAAYPAESFAHRSESYGSFIRASCGSSGGFMFPKPDAGKKKSESFVLHKKQTVDESDVEGVLIAAELKKWRKKQAEEMNVPPYVIFGDRTLAEIAVKKPHSESELLDVYGIGENKAAKFGGAILKIISES
jgi:ATP-dependent DNA helicase RecQ